MKRINEKKDSVMSDTEMAEGLHGLEIPYIDMGEESKTVRFEGPNGQIIDEVVQPGEPGQSWTLESLDMSAMKNEREIKRQKAIDSGMRYDII